jgi:ATP-dependent DNA helicase RecG
MTQNLYYSLDFLRFLEEVGEERMATFSTEGFLVVDLVSREEPVPDHLKSRVGYLLEQGIIERLGRGRGIRLLLSRRFHRRYCSVGRFLMLKESTFSGLLGKE